MIFSTITYIPDDDTPIIACTHRNPRIEGMNIQHISLQHHHYISAERGFNQEIGTVPPDRILLLNCSN